MLGLFLLWGVLLFGGLTFLLPGLLHFPIAPKSISQTQTSSSPLCYSPPRPFSGAHVHGVEEEGSHEFFRIFKEQRVRVDLLCEGFLWSEGPTWAQDALLFSDVKRDAIFEYNPKTSTLGTFRRNSGCYSNPTRCEHLIEPGTNGLAFSFSAAESESRLYLCQHGERQVGVLLPNGSIVTLAQSYRGRRLNSPNDLVVSSEGDIYFSDPSYGLNEKENDSSRELDFNGVYYLTAKDIRLAIETGRPSPLTRIAIPARTSRPNGVALLPSFHHDSSQPILLVSNSNASDPHWLVCRLAHIPEDAAQVEEHVMEADCKLFAHAGRWVEEGRLGSADGLIVWHSHVFATGPGGLHVFTLEGRHLGAVDFGLKLGNVAVGRDAHGHDCLYLCAHHSLLRVGLAA